jgi:hypothetical protein
VTTLSLPIPQNVIDEIANEVEQRVKSKLFGALTLAATPSRKLDVRQLKGGQRSAVVRESAVHAPLDTTMKEIAISKGVQASDNGTRTVRAVNIAREMSSPGSVITSKQVERAWQSDTRFMDLTRGWFRIKL